MSKTQSQTRPHRFFYPAPPSSDVIATATNPRQIGFTDKDLGPTEMVLQTPFRNFSVPPKERIGPTEIAM